MANITHFSGNTKNQVYEHGGQSVTNSILVAQKFDKRHADVLKAIDSLVKKLPDNERERKFSLTVIQSELPNGASRNDPLYIMNRDGFTLLAMGFTGKKALQFKLDYINAFNEMEQHIKNQFKVPTTMAEALRLAADQQEQIESAHKQLAEQAPKVLFAESFKTSDSLILIGEMAKLLNQNGIDIGEQRFYDWLVDNHYLIRSKRWSNSQRRYNNDYMPTQRAADLKIFFVIERPIPTIPGEPPMIKHTVKVTGKGQIYFINKFIKSKTA